MSPQLFFQARVVQGGVPATCGIILHIPPRNHVGKSCIVQIPPSNHDLDLTDRMNQEIICPERSRS